MTCTCEEGSAQRIVPDLLSFNQENGKILYICSCSCQFHSFFVQISWKPPSEPPALLLNLKYLPAADRFSWSAVEQTDESALRGTRLLKHVQLDPRSRVQSAVCSAEREEMFLFLDFGPAHFIEWCLCLYSMWDEAKRLVSHRAEEKPGLLLKSFLASSRQFWTQQLKFNLNRKLFFSPSN